MVIKFFFELFVHFYTVDSSLELTAKATFSQYCLLFGKTFYKHGVEEFIFILQTSQLASRRFVGVRSIFAPHPNLDKISSCMDELCSASGMPLTAEN